MGYYTELKAKLQLNQDAPKQLLEELCNGVLSDKLFTEKYGHVPSICSVSEIPNLPIEHIFGKSYRWNQIFGSRNTKYDKITNTLIIDCDIKAQDDIYYHLLDWLTPFIDSGEFKTKGEDSSEWLILLSI